MNADLAFQIDVSQAARAMATAYSLSIHEGRMAEVKEVFSHLWDAALETKPADQSNKGVIQDWAMTATSDPFSAISFRNHPDVYNVEKILRNKIGREGGDVAAAEPPWGQRSRRGQGGGGRAGAGAM